MTTPSNRTLLLNSAVAFALAGIVATTAHELAHLVAYLSLGHSADLYANAVDAGDNIRSHDDIIAALAGPLFSLVAGLLLIGAARSWGRGFARLFWLWVGFLSAQIGFGYFIIAPFARVGDTGLAFSLLHAPGFVYAVSFILGVIGMVTLSKLFATQAVRYTRDAGSLRSTGLFSWLVGTGILLAIDVLTNRNLPAEILPTIFAGTATIGIFTPMLTFFYKKVQVKRETLVLGTPILGIAVLAASVVVLSTILASGLHIG